MKNQKERWKLIKGFEHYAVSDLGRVKSFDRVVKHVCRGSHMEGIRVIKGKVLKGAKDACGYIHYRLFRNGKTELVKGHTLVGMAFLRIRQVAVRQERLRELSHRPLGRR